MCRHQLHVLTMLLHDGSQDKWEPCGQRWAQYFKPLAMVLWNEAMGASPIQDQCPYTQQGYIFGSEVGLVI